MRQGVVNGGPRKCDDRKGYTKKAERSRCIRQSRYTIYIFQDTVEDWAEELLGRGRAWTIDGLDCNACTVDQNLWHSLRCQSKYVPKNAGDEDEVPALYALRFDAMNMGEVIGTKLRANRNTNHEIKILDNQHHERESDH